MSLTVGSLFAGYGGIDLGLGMILDATPAWFVEFDKHPSAILAQRFPGVPNHGDITRVDWSEVEPVDILTGGFPCQDVSHAGNRAGIKPGTRSGLWSHMAHAIAVLKPRLVVIENVAGLLSADAVGDVEPCPWCLGDEPAGHLRALGAVCADLAEIGFDAEWASVRASDAGAPHRRERVFIVAAPYDDNGRRRQPDAQQWRVPVADQNGNDAVIPFLRLLPTAINRPLLLPTPKASDGPNGGPGMRNGRGVADALPGVVALTDFGPYETAVRRWEAVLGRPAPSPTEPNKDGRPRLSPKFVEFMMGLPDGWVTDTGIPRNAQFESARKRGRATATGAGAVDPAAAVGGVMRTCDEPGCDRKHQARGLCSVHYQRQYRAVCMEDGCGKKVRAKGRCDTHYRQWRKSGWTEAEREHERELRRRRDERREVGCSFCDAAQILDARGYSLTEAARQQRKPPEWLREHLDDHGLSDVLSHHTEKGKP